MEEDHFTTPVKVWRPGMGRGYLFQSRCICGWRSDDLISLHEARHEGHAHELALMRERWENEGGR